MSSTQTLEPVRRIPFLFTGSALEYFKIWIVNISLTIVTLGIYSAWAKVRRTRYFYANTRLQEHSFSYLADPIQILKGRIIAVGFLIIYSLSWDFFPDIGFWLLAIGVLLLPFLIVTATSFNMRNSSYRNIRFFFIRDYKAAYLVFVWPLLLILIFTWLIFFLLDISGIFSLLENQEGAEQFHRNDLLPTVFLFSLLPVLPYLDFVRTRFIINQTQFGKLPAEFSGSGWDFYQIYLVAMLMFMGIGFIFSIVVGVSAAIMGETFQKNLGFLVVFMIIFYGFAFLVSAYIRAKRSNMIYSKTTVGPNQLGCHLKTMKIAWLYLSNTIAIICSLGLLLPWAQIRMTHYLVECMTLDSSDMDSVAAVEQEQSNALGEEMVDAFDLDIGF